MYSLYELFTFIQLCLCFGIIFLTRNVTKGCKASINWTGVSETEVRLMMKNNTYTVLHSFLLSVPKGGHYKLKSYSMLFILCPVRVMSISDSELTASSRYLALHLQTLPRWMSPPHCTEAVIHSNAIRKELKYWHAPCPTGCVCV